MTIKIKGRTRFADKALTDLEISRVWDRGNPLVKIKGGNVSMRDTGEFGIEALHPTATDVEHDSAKLAMFEGAGLRFCNMWGRYVIFTGVILTAKYYTEEPEISEVEECEYPDCEPHGIMEYLPPAQKWEPELYEIRVRFR